MLERVHAVGIRTPRHRREQPVVSVASSAGSASSRSPSSLRNSGPATTSPVGGVDVVVDSVFEQAVDGVVRAVRRRSVDSVVPLVPTV